MAAAILSLLVACVSHSDNIATNPSGTGSSSPATTQISSNTGDVSKFNINTSLETELNALAQKLNLGDIDYDKLNKGRPYSSPDELVAKGILSQAQFDKAKPYLTVEDTLTGEAKDVDYMVKLGLMKGHLLVAKELLNMKRSNEALPHVGHPIEELYVTVADQFKERGVTDFKSTLDEVKDFIKNKPNAPQLMAKFDAGMASVDRAIAAIPQAERQSPKFIPKVISGLVDTANAEYGGAISGNKIEEIDYQDARGFVAYADMLYKDIASPWQKANTKQPQQLSAALQDLRKTWPSVLPPSKPVYTADEVAAKTKAIDTMINGKGTSTGSNSTTKTASSNSNLPANLAKLQSLINDSLTAAKANDLQQAKQKMADVSDFWQSMEDGVKANSKQAYKTLEDGFSEVQVNLVIPPNPDQNKAVASLEALNKTVATYASQVK